MSKTRKIKRQPGVFKKTIYRDARGRYASEENSFRAEYWTYRKTLKNKIVDLKITGEEVTQWQTTYFPTLVIPDTGSRAGKISAQLGKRFESIGVLRRKSEITITMTAKTYHGKTIRRKVSWQTYHMYKDRKLKTSMTAMILQSLFYEHGDRPAYPVKIVKGWRKKRVTKKDTEKRRQLYQVRLHVQSEIL